VSWGTLPPARVVDKHAGRGMSQYP